MKEIALYDVWSKDKQQFIFRAPLAFITTVLDLSDRAVERIEEETLDLEHEHQCLIRFHRYSPPPINPHTAILVTRVEASFTEAADKTVTQNFDGLTLAVE